LTEIPVTGLVATPKDGPTTYTTHVKNISIQGMTKKISAGTPAQSSSVKLACDLLWWFGLPLDRGMVVLQICHWKFSHKEIL